MSDPNLTDFYARIDRIERMHARGFGFEAVGTLGRPGQQKPRGRHLPMLRSVLFVILCVTGLKAAVYHQVGAELYAERVARLEAGEAIDRVGAALMQADPMTLWLADQLQAHWPI